MPSFSFPSFVKKTMSTSWQYGDVSPARYPDLESKRKRRGAASNVNHGGGKKKKESKKKETMTVPSSSSSPTETHGAIQQMVPVGLDAFAKDTVVVVEPKDPLLLLEDYRQGKGTDEEAEVTVLQERGVGPSTHPRPRNSDSSAKSPGRIDRAAAPTTITPRFT